jgi:beta-glucosidase
MVLLKNDNSTLPFKKVKKIALFGKTSYQFMTGGTGSGEVNYDHAPSLYEALIAAKFQLPKSLTDCYKQFIDSVKQQEKKEKQKFAVDFAPELNLSKDFIQSQVKNSDIAVITIGRQAGEGWDRPESSFSLSEVEKNLVKNVCTSFHAAKKKVVVVLNIGGVIETADWRDLPDAILLAWQPGQQGAHAVVDLLKGTENPSGKLAVSFPMKYADVPSAATFPGEPKDNPVNAFYTEGIYVGYRYYETFKVPTAYPFGYGLSYTNFKYSDLKLSDTSFDKEITVSIKITNIGKTAGKEAVQLYLEAPKQAIDKPEKELKAFAKTRLLKPNESEVVTFKLDGRSLASFWSGISAWIADEGKYKIHIGASSDDIRAAAEFSVPKKLLVEKTHDVLYPNFLLHEISPKK